jgi:hypothetical protein
MLLANERDAAFECFAPRRSDNVADEQKGEAV